MTAPIQIAIVDNHTLFRQGMASLLGDFKEVKILFDAENGEDMIGKLKKFPLPDMILMDITMPVMNGYEATAWLQQTHPSVKVLALSMFDDDKPIINMLKSGAVGYMLKESKIRDVVFALETIRKHGYYLNELVSGKLLHTMQNKNAQVDKSKEPTVNELRFLKLSCSELTYKEIAEEMNLSPHTIDNYRESLFQKFGLKSRTGMVLFAIKNELISV
ncbi:response regulator transcription factor [Mucilaginibacter celer]|uniref:Response regulator n=1 Tax=Mucilaginibacter celer TaxID=2305508 RepID=A0A494VYR5_9SPHI|nr:response regulator transcription factor [Mucilaginibacter celer]AYL96142.1 response regulator [Mucilaginibacter celer]